MVANKDPYYAVMRTISYDDMLNDRDYIGDDVVLRAKLIFRHPNVDDTVDTLLNHLRFNLKGRRDVDRFVIVKCKDINAEETQILDTMYKEQAEVMEKIDRLMILLEN